MSYKLVTALCGRELMTPLVHLRQKGVSCKATKELTEPVIKARECDLATGLEGGGWEQSQVPRNHLVGRPPPAPAPAAMSPPPGGTSASARMRLWDLDSAGYGCLLLSHPIVDSLPRSLEPEREHLHPRLSPIYTHLPERRGEGIISP